MVDGTSSAMLDAANSSMISRSCPPASTRSWDASATEPGAAHLKPGRSAPYRRRYLATTETIPMSEAQSGTAADSQTMNFRPR